MNNRQQRNAFETWKHILSNRDQSADLQAFHEFFSAWMMFNFLYKGPGTEKDRVRSFSDLSKFGQAHIQLLSDSTKYSDSIEFLTYRRQPPPVWLASEQLLNVSVWNMDSRRTGRDHQGIIKNREDLCGILDCLYLIRCNLFHGDKLPSNTIDKELLRNGYTILSSLLLKFER
jgi:hypothetical protein